MIFLARWSALACAGSIALAGCSVGGNLEIPTAPTGGGGAGSGAAAGSGGAAGSESAGGGGASSGVSPVLVGITPTPSTSSPGAELEARLTVLAAGTRAVVLALPWDGVAGPEGDSLEADAAFFAEQKRRVLLRLDVVDRLVDRRPGALAGVAWDAPEMIAAAEETIDWMLESTGAEVRFLTFGRDVDVYLDAHPGERAAFVAFMKVVIAHAKVHLDAPADLALGVSFSTAAPAVEPAFADLAVASDVIGFSYLPGLGTFEAGAWSGVASTITTIADAAGKKPIVLEAAGFATDAAAAGAEDSQQKFFAALFGAVSARRSSFALVNVVELFDAEPAACSAWAEAQGAPPDGPLAAYACSLGLFSSGGSPRPAWSAVLAGAAALSTP